MSLLIALLLFALSLAPTALGGPVASFDDIQFWAGAENEKDINRAAMVIDWDDDSSTDEALVWGFRWKGEATGADMLTAIVAADERLYAKVNNLPPSASLLFGLGYDANHDGILFNDSFDDDFDNDGFATGAPFDEGSTVSPNDFYAEGWRSIFWHYGFGGPGAWASSPLGMASTNLTSGDWNSWAFAQPIAFNVFPENLHAAMPPTILGDYNADGIVDSADYSTWLDTLGQAVGTIGAGADGDFSGIVDTGDYTVWKNNFGNAAISSTNSAVSIVIPEPSSMSLAIILLLTLTRRARSVSAWRCTCIEFLQALTLLARRFANLFF